MNNSGWTSNENPKTTDWEEHSAVADLSTGRRFKAVQSVPMKVMIDSVDADTVYVGESKAGIATSESYWRIKKILTSSTITSITFAGGKDSFESAWDDRLSLSYS
jgi:hypothetical protein